jgi:cytochrome c6
MVLRFFIFIFPVSFLFSCGSESSSEQSGSDEDAVNIPNGAELYTQHCTVCHGSDGKLGVSGAKDLTQSTLSDTELIKMIETGKNAMPPMKDPLGSEANIKAVTEYIKGLKK